MNPHTEPPSESPRESPSASPLYHSENPWSELLEPTLWGQETPHSDHEIPDANGKMGPPYHFQWLGTQSRRGGDARSIELRFVTSKGFLEAAFHPGTAEISDDQILEGEGLTATHGVVFAGELDGDLGGPAGIYAQASRQLQRENFAALRLGTRERGHLSHCVLDVLLGIEFLQRRGVTHIALVGHSFGGAVAMTAAAHTPEVSAVAALATQPPTIEVIQSLAGRPLLLLHGQDDDEISPLNSRYVYAMAEKPKEIVLLPNVRHDLTPARAEIVQKLAQWLQNPLCDAR